MAETEKLTEMGFGHEQGMLDAAISGVQQVVMDLANRAAHFEADAKNWRDLYDASRPQINLEDFPDPDHIHIPSLTPSPALRWKGLEFEKMKEKIKDLEDARQRQINSLTDLQAENAGLRMRLKTETEAWLTERTELRRKNAELLEELKFDRAQPGSFLPGYLVVARENGQIRIGCYKGDQCPEGKRSYWWTQDTDEAYRAACRVARAHYRKYHEAFDKSRADEIVMILNQGQLDQLKKYLDLEAMQADLNEVCRRIKEFFA